MLCLVSCAFGDGRARARSTGYPEYTIGAHGAKMGDGDYCVEMDEDAES